MTVRHHLITIKEIAENWCCN